MGILKYKVFNSSKEFEEWQIENSSRFQIRQITPMSLESRGIEVETQTGRKRGNRGTLQVFVVYSVTKKSFKHRDGSL